MPRLVDSSIALRPAAQKDAPLLARWDRQPHVIAATTDDPCASSAFDSVHWPDELAAQNEFSQYFVAELDGRAIGAMQIIDPAREPTHYWGAVAPNLRAIDIWIGEADCLGKGYGESMMRQAFVLCFADSSVKAIIIDPLASNIRAHKFYQRLGFASVNRRMFGDDDCLVHVLKRLDWRARFGGDAP